MDVNWGDGSAHTDFNATSTGPLSAQSHAFALPGTYTVTVTATDPVASGVTAWDLVQTFTVTVAPSVFILDPTAGGALSLSGNASLKIPGAVVVDSSSSSALSASGNASVKAAVIDVHGKVQKSGNASFSPAPVTGRGDRRRPARIAVAAEHQRPDQPGLREPQRQRVADDPAGHLPSISVSGNARLTLERRHLHHRGRRASVSGNASVSGSGVLIVNAGSNYPTARAGPTAASRSAATARTS